MQKKNNTKFSSLKLTHAILIEAANKTLLFNDIIFQMFCEAFFIPVFPQSLMKPKIVYTVKLIKLNLYHDKVLYFIIIL